MSLKDWLRLGDQIAKPIQAVGNLYTTDKARIEAEKDYEAVVQKRGLQQLRNNALMIASGQFFEAGWPALIGWTAGFLIFLYYAPQIVIVTWVWGVNCLDSGVIKPFPMRPDDLLNLVYLLFGSAAHSLFKRG